MATRLLQFPETVRDALANRYRNRHRGWLAGQDRWPLELPLGCPSEQEAQQQPEAVRAWISAWRSWRGGGELIWCQRRWRTLGTQRLPKQLVLKGPEVVAAWLGEDKRWRQACGCYRHFVARWPALAAYLPRYFDALAEYGADDIQRMEDVLAWLEVNPRSNLYPRQLPIGGMDSKWLEGRRALIADLVAGLRGDTSDNLDFFQRCGLKESPQLVRLRILDQRMRRSLGGLGDISAPVDDLAGLDLPVSRVYIVENLQTGLAFDEQPGAVVFMRLGYAVDVLGRLPWLSQTDCVYWGDLDTHGFAILNRARSYLPNLTSALMDEDTLLSHRNLWVNEKEQHAATELPLLTHAEHAVYQGLKRQHWGLNIRLEQERIAWDRAWNVLQQILSSDGRP